MENEFRYKEWANHELIDAISGIDKSKYPDQFRLALRLLNHTYVVDQIFKAHLTGLKHSYSWVNTDETPTVIELRKNIGESDIWFVEYARSLKKEELSDILNFTFTDGEGGRMKRSEILNHLLIHGAYHRGNIGMVLSECGVEKPNDTFTRFLHYDDPSRRT